MRNHSKWKAAAAYHITTDLLKGNGQIVLGKLATLYTQCLMTSTIPGYWENAIILIHKKADVRDLKNYRPMSLLSLAYRAFTKVIANRNRTTLDFRQPNDQAGFRKGYSAIGHLHTINQVIEK